MTRPPATRVVDAGPLGTLLVEVVDGRLWSVGFVEAPASDAGDDPVAEATAAWLRAFLEGPVEPLDVPRAERGTPFQRQVWDLVFRIPWGRTRAYGALAEALGDPKKTRAVGTANGANPFALVVPCHRVIGADGSLVGYAGGLHRKRRLLAHEGAISGMLFG